VLRICLGPVLIAAVWAQGAADSLTFEVASIKASATQGMITRMAGGPGTGDPGLFTATNAELSALLMRAYGIQYDQIKGPSWMDETEFDVAARVPPGTTAEQLRKMLQNLLAERFRMQVHRETRVAPVYALTVAKNGPKLKPAAKSSGADDFVPSPRRVDSDNFPALPPGRPNGACGNLPDGSYCTFRMVTMAMLVQRLVLPNFVGCPVIDKTGLAGPYDFTLYYRPMNRPPSPDLLAPDIEQAIEQQLGLKLSPFKEPMDVLVIDRIDKMPTEN
jgi:uncharacterized protein (TIGR03435 family)